MKKPTTKEKSKLMVLVAQQSKSNVELQEKARDYLASLEMLKGDVDDLIDEGGLSVVEAKNAMEFYQDTFILTEQLSKIANGEAD